MFALLLEMLLSILFLLLLSVISNIDSGLGGVTFWSSLIIVLIGILLFILLEKSLVFGLVRLLLNLLSKINELL